jgi:hypothetical protein
VTFHPLPYSANPSQTIHIRTPFTRWFTSDGYFVAKPFQQWLASEVPVIGAADPNNVVEEIGRGSGHDETAGAGAGGFNVSGTNAMDILEQLKNQASAGVASGVKAAGGSQRKRKM